MDRIWAGLNLAGGLWNFHGTEIVVESLLWMKYLKGP